MIRRGLILAMLVVFCHGPALAQGWMDSIFGSGGLGLWDSGVAGQWNNPQFYGGSQMQGAQGAQPLYGQQPLQPANPEAVGQGYAQQPQPQYYPQGYPQGYPQSYPQGNPQVAPTYSQQGIYSDWQTTPPTPVGPQAQQGQYVQPQQQYAPPQQYAAPPQQPARQKPRARRLRAGNRQTTAPAAPPVSVQVQPQPGMPQGPAVQQGHYAPSQQPVSAEDLPAGAVQMTTTTPAGTQIQYYPPPGMAVQQQPAVQPQPRRKKPRSSTRSRTAKPQMRERTAANEEAEVAPSIPMPKPVQIPQGHDPREGWGRAKR